MATAIATGERQLYFDDDEKVVKEYTEGCDGERSLRDLYYLEREGNNNNSNQSVDPEKMMMRRDKKVI